MNYVGFPNTFGPAPAVTPTNSVDATGIYGTGSLGVGAGINMGGANGLSINGAQGIWAGASTFALAPFSVDLLGNVKASTLTITGFIAVAGAAADINANATTVNGNKITGATITTSQIASSTITGSNISSSTITGSNISASTITGGNIAASTITAGLLSVSTLDAISANLGTITAGSITGVTITGTTITGGTIQTSTTNKRVLLSSTNNDIEFFDSSGTQSGFIYGNSTSISINCGNPASSSSQVSLSGGSIVIFTTATGGTISLGSDTNVTGNLTQTGSKIGFYSATAVTQPTVTGSRAGNAALASLLTKLATLGLIVDSST